MSKKLVWYFVITYLWAWILWTPFILPSFGVYPMSETLEGLIMVAVMIGAFGPLVAAVILTYQEGRLQGVKAFFKKCLNVRVHWKFYLIAIILSFTVTMVAHYVTIWLASISYQTIYFPKNLIFQSLFLLSHIS